MNQYLILNIFPNLLGNNTIHSDITKNPFTIHSSITKHPFSKKQNQGPGKFVYTSNRPTAPYSHLYFCVDFVVIVVVEVSWDIDLLNICFNWIECQLFKFFKHIVNKHQCSFKNAENDHITEEAQLIPYAYKRDV